MAAVLAAGPGAMVSHASAAFLWGLIAFWPAGPIHVTGPGDRGRRRPGWSSTVAALTGRDRAERHGIPVTSPARTIVDTAPELSAEQLERRINLADSLDLIDPEALAAELPRMRGQRGVRPVRNLIEQYTFRLTDSELEQRFLRVAAPLRLGPPTTRRRLNGFRTDFVWPDLGLVVEADSLRYHRTPGQQQRDHLTRPGASGPRHGAAAVHPPPDHLHRVLRASHDARRDRHPCAPWAIRPVIAGTIAHSAQKPPRATAAARIARIGS